MRRNLNLTSPPSLVHCSRKRRQPYHLPMAKDDRDFVLQQCRQQDVKFIRLWFTDILGSLKNFAITLEDLEDAMEGGVGFDRSEERRVGKECRSRTRREQ